MTLVINLCFIRIHVFIKYYLIKNHFPINAIWKLSIQAGLCGTRRR